MLLISHKTALSTGSIVRYRICLFLSQTHHIAILLQFRIRNSVPAVNSRLGSEAMEDCNCADQKPGQAPLSLCLS